METLKKLFPLSFKYTKSGKDLAIGIIFYVLIAIAAGLLGTILGLITFGLSGICAAVVELYCVAGVVIQILLFVKVLNYEAPAEEKAEEKTEE